MPLGCGNDDDNTGEGEAEGESEGEKSGPECGKDQGCDDADPCTMNSCVEMYCLFEVDDTLVPDDGIFCTVDSCANGVAVNSPDDSRCDADSKQICDSQLGCVDT